MHDGTAHHEARERDVLVGALEAQRHHVLGVVEGLGDADAHRGVLPTGWSCLGLIQHLTFDVEELWFRMVAAGRPAPSDAPPDAWVVGDGATASDVLARYRAACDEANLVIERMPLDTPPAWWPAELFGDWRLGDLRELLVHVITETACHAGHLDAARELIDGRTWLILS